MLLDRRTAALLEETLTEYGVGGLAGALEEDAEGCAHLVGESEEEYGERSGASA